MKKIINSLFILIALCSCGTQTPRIESPATNQRSIKTPIIASNNIIIVVDNLFNKNTDEISKSAMLALENASNDVGCAFIEAAKDLKTQLPSGHVLGIISFSESIVDGQVQELRSLKNENGNEPPFILVSDRRFSGRNIMHIAKSDVSNALQLVMRVLSKTSHKNILFISNNHSLLPQLSSIIAPYKRSDMFVDIASPSQIPASAAQKYDIAICMTLPSAIANSHAKKIETCALVNTFYSTIRQILSSGAKYFVFRNFNAFRNFSDIYVMRFNTYPTLAGAICFDVVRSLLSHTGSTDTDAILADLVIGNSEQSVYRFDETTQSVSLVGY